MVRVPGYRFLQMLARSGIVAGRVLDYAVQVEKIRVMRSQRKQLAAQRRGQVVLAVEHQHAQVDSLRLYVFGVPLSKLRGQLWASWKRNCFT